MHLRDWIRTHTPEQRTEAARRAGTSLGHLWQLAGGHRRASPDLAKRLEAATDGAVTRSDLRPDIWEPEAAA